MNALAQAWRTHRVDKRKAAGIGLMLLTLAVTPCHIYMLQHPELFPVPLWALWLRLPIQALLLWLIHWSTRGATSRFSSPGR